MDRRLAWVTVTMLSAAFVFTSCSSGPNLAQDQATVNQWQARVSSDRQAAVDAEWNYGADLGTPPTPCTEQQQLSTDISHYCGQSAPTSMTAQEHALLGQTAARLQKDRFNLEVAQNRLKKDESGG